jgi:hypothetical protein
MIPPSIKQLAKSTTQNSCTNFMRRFSEISEVLRMEDVAGREARTILSHGDSAAQHRARTGRFGIHRPG